MTEGFYTHRVHGLILCIKNHSLNTFEVYEVSSTSLKRIKYYFFPPSTALIMPFDHYPSLEELQQLPELFI